MSGKFYVYRPAPPNYLHDMIQNVYQDLDQALIDFLDAVRNEGTATIHWSA